MIRQAEKEDSRVLAEMAVCMWDSHTTAELEMEFAQTIEEGQEVFFIQYQDQTPVGFAQCSMRSDYVEGTESSPVGYLEGIFVDEAHRRQGCARKLLAACEEWAKKMGCSEFASDCELDNRASLSFHLSMGFEEANRIICFTKKL